MLVDLNDYKKVFRGSCHAVALKKRGEDDNHVIIEILTEDDEQWFSGSDGFSNYWINALVVLLHEAEEWMVFHCEQDIKDNRFWGYKFK